MKIAILGAHNVETRQTRCTSLVIDGAVALDAGSLTSRLSLKAQLKLEAVLLTHRHYDHVKDIPALGMNFYLAGKQLELYAIRSVMEDVSAHLLDGVLYPDYRVIPPEKPALKINLVEPGREVVVAGYKVLPVMVPHAVPCAGYQLTAADGKKLFYTSDTGPGLADAWRQVSPDLLIIELTTTDRWRDFVIKAGHLTPALLKKELKEFRKLKGFLPRVVTLHANPRDEKEMAAELAQVAAALGADIQIAAEGMKIEL